MSLDNAWNAYIFRDGKVTLDGKRLVSEFVGALLAVETGAKSSRDEIVDLLLRSGELECALRDGGSADAGLVENLTNALANTLVKGTSIPSAELSRAVATIAVPDEINVAPPEGFAYYALHPLDMADLARRVAPKDGAVAVIGIRSIGTTLSAVVQSTLRSIGLRSERITVRPNGHPYNRQTEFSENQRRWIDDMRSHGAMFFVVDEGPGMSGSSFLSVGDALISAGVARSRMAFLCTRDCDPASLTATNAVERWNSFTVHCTEPTRYLPPNAKEYVAGGIWRAKTFDSEDGWPASWIQMERLKFLSADCSRIYRFEGYGRFGYEVCRRALKVAEFGFGPLPERQQEGFGVYPMLRGRYLSPEDVDRNTLDRLGEYCVFRARHVTAAVSQTPELEIMLRYNIELEFGVSLPEFLTNLPVVFPVIADGRMLPHKWIRVDGALLKLDSAAHGDDHFFPGPTDVAWDLAGAIVEWELSPEATSVLLNSYRRRTGEDVADRLPNYLLAYGVFRTAFCKMAAAAMQGHPEFDRMLRAYGRYRASTEKLLTHYSAVGAVATASNNAQVA